MSQNKESLKQTLLNNLSGYGLNPKQWRLQKTKENIYWIRHKEIPTWYFRGVTGSQEGSAEWSKISLVSL